MKFVIMKLVTILIVLNIITTRNKLRKIKHIPDITSIIKYLKNNINDEAFISNLDCNQVKNEIEKLTKNNLLELSKIIYITNSF